MILAKLGLGVAQHHRVRQRLHIPQRRDRVDVDEHRDGAPHVHFWVPAAAVPMAMHSFRRNISATVASMPPNLCRSFRLLRKNFAAIPTPLSLTSKT